MILSDVDGKASITLKYTKADLGNKYTLVEVDTGVIGYVYSLTKYEFEFEVTVDSDYKLSVVAQKNGSAEKALEAEFINTYQGVEPPPTGIDSGLKVWLPIMLLSGGAFVGITVLEVKKRRAKQ